MTTAAKDTSDIHKNGHFERQQSTFRNFVSRDPSSEFPAEKGRYALYVSPGCPWAHRTLVTRLLKGLEDVIDLYQLHYLMGPEGWYFSGTDGSLPEDPLHGFKKIRELYLKTNPSFSGRFTVPVLWDKKKDVLVNNESAEIIRMMYSEFDEFLPEHLRESSKPNGGLYPEGNKDLRAEIDALNEWVYDTVNNGVYKVGFAKTQEAYDKNVGPLFSSLDKLESKLASHGKRYLLGDYITEADIRLYTTIARFDTAYVPVFLCNLKTIRNDYPNLHLWLRRLYWSGSDKGYDPEGKAWKDEKDPTSLRGAFYRSSAPNKDSYRVGYAYARQKNVFGDGAPVIVPAGPAEVILELKPDEA